MRMSLRLPSVRTMRNDAKIVGEIEDSGNFTPIRISNPDSVGTPPLVFTGQRYEYRELDRVRESCREKKAGKEGKKYPDGRNDEEMQFDLSIKHGDGDKIGSAYFSAVRAENYDHPVLDLPLFVRKPNTGEELKMRYKVTIYPYYRANSSSGPTLDWPLRESYAVMTAEGVYDPETGQLCMVACRNLALNSVASFDDCEVAVELELPAWYERRYIKGIIGSTRPPTDALHFDDLILQS